MKEKVFCLGMSRTGTKSFAVGMKKLGVKACHNGGRPLNELLLKEHQAFSDSNTCMFHYEYLYNRYPDAKFILTYRDPEDWANKILSWYNPKYQNNYVHWHLNNDYVLNLNTKEELINFNKWQYSSILDYFKDKPGSFLAHSFFENESFNPIAEFLGYEIEDELVIKLKDQSVNSVF